METSVTSDVEKNSVRSMKEVGIGYGSCFQTKRGAVQMKYNLFA